MSEWLGIGFTQLDSTKSVKKVCITLKGSCFPGTFVIAFNEMWFRSGPTKDWLKLELYPDSFSCDSSVQPSWTRDNSTCFQVRSISSEYTFSISKSILILYYKHLSKRTCDLKQNGTQEKAPFSVIVFCALALGVVCFVPSVSSRNHFLIGQSSSFSQWEASIWWFQKLTVRTKRTTP